MIDLQENYLQLVQDILRKFVPAEEVKLFGSRARGTAKSFSDIDLVIMNEQALSLEQFAKLTLAFEESDLPYKVDVVQWAELSDDFKKLIVDEAVAI
jgi:type I restriction enzyme S subunit